MKINYLFLGAFAFLSACTTTYDYDTPQSSAAVEIKGISASISQGTASTRAVAEVKDAVGRTAFATDDKIVFTLIQRTNEPLNSFKYKNIHYKYTTNGKDGSWSRVSNGATDPKEDPEKIYWTDGASFHTFMGYCLPSADYSWTPGTTEGSYEGELKTTDFTGGNDDIVKEDLLLCCNKDVTSPDHVSAKVNLTHALSNVHVIVNIKNFAASSSATDVKVTVSDMKLTNQPTKFVWDGETDSLKVADNASFAENIKLWCPNTAGEGKDQSRTFTFYGLAVPQGNEQLKFSFTVTYPNPMNPNGEPLEKNYEGAFSKKVYFHSGKSTTLNITLSHQDEQIFTGAQYSDWSFEATPDLGELRKKSTYMTDNMTVTTCADGVTADNAIWLYKEDNNVFDIYGNDGTASKPYRITSAEQMLSFAKEVNSGNLDFEGKYIRLDADITMQKSSTATGKTWTSIGATGKKFQGTFLGGDRFINRLSGNPLFATIGEHACVEQLQITCVDSIANGALAKTNSGMIGGCRVIDDAKIIGTDTDNNCGALVGANSGTIHACYYTGDDVQLVGANSGTIIGCYFASDSELKSAADLTKDLKKWYDANSGKFKTKYQYTATPGSLPTVVVLP
jgi:hypothetical protein